MSTIIITGVAGLIGSRMAEWIKKNYPTIKVIGIDNLSGGHSSFIPEDIEFIEADLASCSLSDFIGEKIDLVFHFAAYAAEGLSPFIRRFNYTNNLIATTNLVNFCINNRVQRFVFTSSMAVYGYGEPPFTESQIPAPIDPYGVAKYACEMDIKIASAQHGLDYCIIRPHNVYGINQNIWDMYRNVFGIWMYNKLNGLPFTIYGTGEQKRAFTFVDDILMPLWKAGTEDKTRNETINLGGLTEISILKGAKLLSKIVGENEITHLEERHEVKNAFCSHEKAIQLLDFEEKTSLEVGLAKMWEWARKLPQKPRSNWEEYEVERQLYTYWS